MSGVLAAVLDRLLPPDGELPGAGGLGLAAAVVADGELLGSLPDGFAELPADEQGQALRAAEATHPEAFAALVRVAYIAYYTDARVLRRIESDTGYAARPPQPVGYELAPFEEDALAVIRQRRPQYRETR